MASAEPLSSSSSDDDVPTERHTNHRRTGNLLTDTAAALVSSGVFTAAFYPFHRIKILLQTQYSNPLITAGTIKPYTFTSAVPRLLHEGGAAALWRGMSAYMLRHVPSTTLSFAFKDMLLRVLPHYDAGSQLAAAAGTHLLAGGLGGAMALAFVYPLDFATIRMASELRQAKMQQGVLDTLDSAQRRHGMRSWYRGYGVSAVAIGGYKALYFGLYDTAVAWLQHHQDTQPTLLQRYMAANAVVLAASTATYPLDVVRKRLVADTALPHRQFRGFAQCMQHIWRAEGLPGFYRFYGYDMLLRLGGGVLLVLYDEIKQHGVNGLMQTAMREGAALKLGCFGPPAAAAATVGAPPHELRRP